MLGLNEQTQFEAACSMYLSGNNLVFNAFNCAVTKLGTGQYRVRLSSGIAANQLNVVVTPYNSGGSGTFCGSYAIVDDTTVDVFTQEATEGGGSDSGFTARFYRMIQPTTTVVEGSQQQ